MSKYAKDQKFYYSQNSGDFSSLRIIKKLNFPAIKISSGLMNKFLIRKCAKMKLPIIISTGFAEYEEIEALKNITKYHKKLAVLKCTSLYPAPLTR